MSAPRFSLARARVGAYFNDGRSTIWYQVPAVPRGEDPSLAEMVDPMITKAVRAACKEFDRVYWKEYDKRPKKTR